MIRLVEFRCPTIKQRLTCWISMSKIKLFGFWSWTIKLVGFRCQTIKLVGFRCRTIKVVGFRYQTIKLFGFLIQAFILVGFRCQTIKLVGFHSTSKLIRFRAQTLNAGFGKFCALSLLLQQRIAEVRESNKYWYYYWYYWYYYYWYYCYDYFI